MRLHSLRVQAFGPFAGVEEVDLDALAEDGLFLLHGQTGAGKTSVLDAVCFALYGRVPGARAAGLSDLRSHHAAPDVAPEVVCELSVGGRRFEVTRSPAWERPKRRGAGTTSEQARTLLREWDGGQWQPLSSRNDEASQVLTDVLGMGLEQFTKVVLLPQGEFAAFLRSGEKERRPLLQRLFATDRFAAVESWLADQRAACSRELAAHEARLGQLLAGAERLAAAWPEHPEHPEHQPEAAEDVVDLREHTPTQQVSALLQRVRAASVVAEAAHATAREAAREARTGEQGARARAERSRTLHRLRAEASALAAQEEQVQALRRRSAAGHRAAAVAGHLDAADRAGEVAAAAALAGARARAALAAVAPDLLASDPAALSTASSALRAEGGRLEELVALEADAASRTRELAELRARTARLETARATAEQRLASLAARRERTAEEVTAAAELAAQLPAVRTAQEAAASAARAAERAEALTAATTALGDDLRAATDAAQTARQVWLDVRQARIEGMAAELAAALVPGQPCAVCGSPEHPSPAGRPAPAAPEAAPGPLVDTVVDAAAEQRAQRRSEAAEAARAQAATALAQAQADLAGARAAGGGLSGAQARALHERSRAAVAVAEAAESAVGAARAALATLEAEVTATAAAREDAAGQLLVSTARAEELIASGSRDRARLDAARGGDLTLAARRERLLATAGAAEALSAALGEQARTDEAEHAARAEAEAAAGRAGFPAAADARAAACDAQELAAMDARVREHETALAAVTARLGEPACVAAAAEHDADPGTDPDLLQSAAAAAVAGADAALEDAARTAERCRSAERALDQVRAEVEAELSSTAALRERAVLVGDLARCAEGTGGGNTRRMRLSTYVLAARLEQVAAAATTRLLAMSDARYTLVHTDDLERRGAGSGLGLRVVDAWTGQRRDTATLSGGETFLASLALALGLADVVQAEAGGTAIETLFIDEGFGTLDEETLEEVMATLEQLRAGGRAVGLVSHVAELRTRIPSRLEVVKGRDGSRLRAVLA